MARTFITLFMILLTVFLSMVTYEGHHHKTEFEDIIYTYSSVIFGATLPIIWLAFYETALIITFIAMGIMSIGVGVSQLVPRDIALLAFLAGVASITWYILNRLLKETLTRGFKSATTGILVCVFCALLIKHQALEFFVGGLAFTYLGIAVLVYQKWPDFARSIGIVFWKPQKIPNDSSDPNSGEIGNINSNQCTTKCKPPSDAIINAYYETRRSKGWAHLGTFGNFLKQSDPSFNPKKYGCRSLLEFIQRFPDFEIQEHIESDGRSKSFYIRLKRS